MALTKEDLQAIGELVDQKLESRLESSLYPIRADIQGLKSDIQGLQSDVQGLKTDVQGLKTDVQGLKTDVQGLKTDVQELKADMSEVKQRVTKIEITQENVVLPRLQLLAEGHSGLASRMDCLEELPDQVEDIQTTVSVLKHVFKGHTHN